MKPTAPGAPKDGGGKRPERLRGPFLVAKNRAGHVLLTPCPQPGAPQIWLRTTLARI